LSKKIPANLLEVNLKTDYNTDDDNIIRDLYSPCFKVSTNYDRAVGYFRANIYRELGVDLLDFVIKGGKVRIICSPHIPKLDERYAREGYNLRGSRSEKAQAISLLQIFESMSKNPIERDCLEMLRFLIEKESLDLYIATRPGGIYHRKIGRFTDSSENKVIFSGSGNETIMGVGAIEDWSNDEDFDIYRNWGDPFEVHKFSTKENHIDNLLNGKSGRTNVRKLDETEQEFLSQFRKYEDFEECREGALERTNKSIGKRTFSGLTPYIYQREAIEKWRKAGEVGMISMPTGVGKTYTALFGIEETLKKGDPVLIVVPSAILLNQWCREISKIYPKVPMLLAGAGNRWKDDPLKRMFVSPIRKPRIILSTMMTAASADFITFANQANNLLLIADEAHRLGSPVHQQILNINFKGKMGLSATPMRLYDDKGNDFLNKEFGETPIFDLSIGAKVHIDENTEVPILGHFLSRYNYYFYRVDLIDDEKEAYMGFSEQIRKLSAIVNNSQETISTRRISKRLSMLLIQRARIPKKAVNKIAVIQQIISERYPSNGKWIVYCEDKDQLNQVTDLLRDRFSDTVILNYHSNMGTEEKQRSLSYFEDNPCIIVSIRCLDEGVDIPDANGAIILASSTNPRQYIQRRGRVLRKALGKKDAIIIDVLVIPSYENIDVSNSLISNELARAWSFSQNAINQDVTHVLWELCRTFDVDLDLSVQLGFEEEE
jgi:superfamily II DNA or RNA helicase